MRGLDETCGKRRHPELGDVVRNLSLRYESMDQAVIATSLAGTIIYWNPIAERLYGWAAHEVIGRDIVEVTPLEQAREQAEAIMRELQAGRTWCGPFPVRRRDGARFVAVVTDSPLLNKQGQLVGIVGVSSNFARLLETLTPTELAIFEHLATGATNARIAGAIGISEGTVRNSVARLVRKLRVADRTQVALLAFRAGLGADPDQKQA